MVLLTQTALIAFPRGIVSTRPKATATAAASRGNGREARWAIPDVVEIKTPRVAEKHCWLSDRGAIRTNGPGHPPPAQRAQRISERTVCAPTAKLLTDGVEARASPFPSMTALSPCLVTGTRLLSQN